ncbi:MAG: DNA polymerase III subunit delta [Candidatus Aminicenantes bacterium]|nr:DNA polymerase III subunit delta [Candidatus Aminicenantes bacterium]
MRSFLLNKDLQEKDLVPCYFLYGEETFLAQEFLGQLRELLIPPDVPDFNVERLHFEDTSWREVIDLARTAPFIFSPWRIIALEMPPADKKDKGEDERKKKDIFSDMDERLVGDYLAAPASRTILMVILPGRTNKSRRLMKFFASFPAAVVLAKEMKPLKDRNLWSWMNRKMAGWKKAIVPEAMSRLTELVGNDLQRLDKELDKLATYVGDKKSIDEEDVKAASGWTKGLENWEPENALEARDVNRCLAVLAKLFTGGTAPELVLYILGNFFRTILAAQEGLASGRDKKDIFREFRPRITENYGKWYFDRLNDFFSSVQGLSRAELDDCLQRLNRIDYRLKTSDISARTELEVFVVDYCRRRRPEKLTWKARR